MDPQYTAHNLIPNKEYEFRVAALNEAGLSDWSDSSDLIEAKNPEGTLLIHDCVMCVYIKMKLGVVCSSFKV